MDKIKRFIDIQVPVTTCTLRCHYCYITQHKLFSAKVPKLKYSAEQIGKALSKERLGGVAHLNICGNGETLLPPEMTDIVRVLLEQGHYIMIVNNGTITQRFKEMMEQYPPELKKRLGFKFSFHYLELKKKNLMDRFFDNIRLVRDNGCSFSLEMTPSDELIPHIEDIKKICKEQVGALCHVTVARDENVPGFVILSKLSREEYQRIWGQFNSPLFDFKMSIFNQKRNEFCYSGLWGGILDLGTGVLRACDCTFNRQNILDDPTKPIDLKPKGHCNKAHCHNGHAWLGLGMIPELSTPFYAEMRDRVDKNGNHWLVPEMREFLSQKLADNNDLISDKVKNRLYHQTYLDDKLWNLRAKLGKIYYSIKK
ncbi:MAG: radical SAM protein [Bacteroides sp.]|nr:radical SAM protein [Bacteroides sp.]